MDNGASFEVQFNVEEGGLYFINIIVAPCGMGDITKAGAYFSFELSKETGEHIDINRYTQLVIPISAAWVAPNPAFAIVNIESGAYKAKFTNNTGVKTSYYNSVFGARLVKLS